MSRAEQLERLLAGTRAGTNTYVDELDDGTPHAIYLGPRDDQHQVDEWETAVEQAWERLTRPA